MERRFFMNDFEASLKEHADQFKMIPSKRVWHGIYNDLQPGRRWPSVTMSLLLIFTLVVIGHLNTNNSHRSIYLTAHNTALKNLNADLNTNKISESNAKNALRNSALKLNNNKGRASTVQSLNIGLPIIKIDNTYQNKSSIIDRNPADNLKSAINLKSANNSSSPDLENNTGFLPERNSKTGMIAFVGNIQDENIQLQNNINLKGVLNNSAEEIIVENYFNNFLPTKEGAIKIDESLSNLKFLPNKNIYKIVAETKSPDSYKNLLKLYRKKYGKTSWVYFIAPVISSVSFDGEPVKLSLSSSLSPSVAINQKGYKVLHNSALGFEAGAQMNYKLVKKLELTTGLDLTYSGYKIISNEVHPTFATLVLKDPSTGMLTVQNYITHYGDGTGQTAVTLRNYSWQASIPVGLQYEFMGNDKLQFNASANIEPSFVLKSNAYMLSSDGNNYVNDPSLLRKWNASSNFGVFVTFSSSKFKWQIGPNIRYQWLSTYQKEYTVKEHLIDYGIRIGISK
jgi:hypothetical protein